MLLDIQNRGELATGVTGYNPAQRKLLHTHKGFGTVREAFGKDCLGCLSGDVAAIGHVRYATTGDDDLTHAQPFERIHGRKDKWFSFAFNGQLDNYQELRDKLRRERNYHFAIGNDTEVMMHYLARQMSVADRPHYPTVFANLARFFSGAYSIAFLNANGDLIIARDPHGYRPLAYGHREGYFMAASESVALSNLGCTHIEHLEPGHFIRVDKNDFNVEPYIDDFVKRKHCFFEWVYFSNVASSIDGKSVYNARYRLGKTLADRECNWILGRKPIIVPVPDTAKVIADAMGFYTGLPVREGLIRNRYVGRTFIKGAGRERRADAIASKYTKIGEVFRGKHVILVDDSLVRGNTMRALVRNIRNSSPKSIHLRIASPPIGNPCQRGIDIPTFEELYINNFATREDMAKDLEVDSIEYLTMGQARQAILNSNGNMFCDECVVGSYK
jgi:amidophosphoribosyltransferase